MTDSEILAYVSVPVQTAAEYLGVSRLFIQNGLQQGALPFGCCVVGETGKRIFDIRPQALVDYKRNGKKIIYARFHKVGRELKAR